MNAFRSYEADKPVEQYKYRVEELEYAEGYVTDTIYTDNRATAERILSAMLEQAYPLSRIVEQLDD